MEMRLDLEHTGVLLFDLQQGEADEAHPHDHYQISIPMSRSIAVRHNGTHLHLDAEKALIVPPGDVHQHEASGGKGMIMLISFNETVVQKVLEGRLGQSASPVDFSALQPVPAAVVKEAEKQIQTAAFKGIDQVLSNEEAFTETILTHIEGSHTNLWQQAAADHLHRPEGIAAQVQAFVNEHFREDLTLDVVAFQMNMSKYHLHRVFVKQTGRTPRAYIHEIRLEEAARQLMNPGRDITTTAFDVGYQSLSTFSRAFKARFGVTAKVYADQHR
ncbi:AraC family transcriptional regulator [Halobacillus sp. Cin3]|uniref:helix-turn-helix transcriptional regulator n=1 Tax=Halobacillus sp. Cin3 TaxID=2928441 RepID=UPI00248D87A0|nr:AraC family transcriptional regulator [Halobacillus sp. Cin3]